MLTFLALNVKHKLFSRDLPIADIAGLSPHREHILSLLVCIDVSKRFSHSIDAEYDLLQCLLVEPGSLLLFEASCAVDSTAKVALHCGIHLGANVLATAL